MSQLQPDEALYSLLCKYLLNEADAVERSWVDAWLQEQPANTAVLGSIQKMLEVPPAVPSVRIDTEASWRRLRQNIGEAPARRNMYYRIAAVLVVSVGMALSWMLIRNRPAAEQVFSGLGEQVLEDGSRVQMGKNAELTLLKGFGQQQRQVRFKGAATFNVASDPEHPFVILMGTQQLKVLGTKFSVDYADSLLLVHVNSGKVMITSGADTVVLTKGMVLRRSDAQFFVGAHVQDIRRKELAFRDVELRQVLQTVEAVYGVTISIADTAMLSHIITANFENEPIENVMATIAFMTNTQAAPDGVDRYSIR